MAAAVVVEVVAAAEASLPHPHLSALHPELTY